MEASSAKLPREHFEIKRLSNAVKLFSEAKCISDQVTIVKSIFTKFSDENLQFLCDMYFDLLTKHEVRNQISRLLQKSNHHSIENVLSNSIRKLLMNKDTTKENSIKYNLVVSSLSYCFDNFPIGKTSFKRNLDLIFPFLCSSLHRYLKDLSRSSSSSTKSDLFVFIHNCIRLLLLTVQEININFYKDNLQKIEELLSTSEKIILNDDTPMDTKVNCGILTVYLKRCSGYYQEFFSNLLESLSSNYCLKLCLSIGIINTINKNNFQLYKRKLFILIKNIIKIANDHSTKSNVLLATARSLNQFIKNLVTICGDDVNGNNKNTRIRLKKYINEIFFNYVLNYIENSIDNVRYLCKDLLRNLFKLQKHSGFDNKQVMKVFSSLLLKENSELLNNSTKCQILINISEIFGFKYILKFLPNIFQIIFNNEQLEYDSNFVNCYTTLMIINYNEVNYRKWSKYWILPIIKNLSSINEKFNINNIDKTQMLFYDNYDDTNYLNNRLKIYENLINNAIKCNAEVCYYILNKNKKFVIPIRTYLSILWTIRKNGIKFNNFDKIFIQASNKIKYSMITNCNEMKLVGLRLLIETNKTTEIISNYEYDNIMLFIKYNLSCQHPSITKEFINLITKFIKRIDLNLKKLLKIKNESRNIEENIQQYIQILEKFIIIFKSNLYDDANFNQRSMSLNLLNECIKTIINNKINLNGNLLLSILQILFKNLKSDSYETNKLLIVEIIENIVNYLKETNNWSENNFIDLQTIHNLMISNKPTDSITAAYYLELFCNLINENQATEFFNERDKLPKYNPIVYCAIKWCLGIIYSGINIAEKSLVLVSKFNPLYGTLFSIRHLITKLSFHELKNYSIWKQLIGEVIQITKKLSKIVQPIVNNSSPEGNLPNDFNDLPDYLRIEKYNKDNHGDSYIKVFSLPLNCNNSSYLNLNVTQDSFKITSQMILVCAWRTVKEISLILGEIVYRAFFTNTKENNSILSRKIIFDIGDHFIELLLETKHRGAFEQAYIGFLKVCYRLWKIDCIEFNQLPMKWLQELFEIISINDDEKQEQLVEQIQNKIKIGGGSKICATRRGAGIPFIIQAIVISELQIGTTKSLHYCMKNLLEICKNVNNYTKTNSVSQQQQKSRTHALNILRALFRCTDLSEIILEYIAEGIICAIDGYAALSWDERNSSTLLFSALIVRIFGVQRDKDLEKLNIRNKMTGRIFFLRYPKLYDYFLKELKNSIKEIENNQTTTKLHPVLIILNRLHPSPLEGTESISKLSTFVPLLFACSGIQIMKTRFLVAKATASLLSMDCLQSQIEEYLLILKQYHLNANFLHGTLLQVIKQSVDNNSHIQDILHKVPKRKITDRYSRKIFYLLKLPKQISSAESIISDLLNVVFENALNAVQMKTILDIFIEIFCSTKVSNLSENIKEKLLYLGYRLNTINKNYFEYYPIFRKSSVIFNLQLFLHCKNKFYQLPDFISMTSIKLKSFEETETILNILLFLCSANFCSNRKKIIHNFINQYECTKQESDFINSLIYSDCDIFKSSLILKIFKSNVLFLCINHILNEKFFYPECTTKAYVILSHIMGFNDNVPDFEEYFTKLKNLPYDMKYSISMCTEKIIKKKSKELISPLGEVIIIEIKSILKYLQDISQPWNPYLLRLSALRSLIHIYKYFNLVIKDDKNFKEIVQFSCIILKFLIDDDSNIRDSISKLICKMFPIKEITSYDNIISTYALELFMKKLAEEIHNWPKDTIKDIFENILKSLKIQEESNYNKNFKSSDDDDLEIFDKNEVNVYGETELTKTLIIQIFLDKFYDNLDIVEFISKFK